MKIAIIGRTEVLYETALRLKNAGHCIVFILTAREAPEYTRTAADFRELAYKWGIPFAKSSTIINHSHLLQETGADIGVSVNYSGIVPQSVIKLFPFGILNAHGGDLPRYRGNACQAWAIINGEDKVGLCVHRMIGGELDSGDILARDYLPINHTTRITDVLDWMSRQTPELFLRAVNCLEQDPHFVLERQSEGRVHALRCYPRKPEDGKINWSLPCIDVLRLINASNKPYSGAFCHYKEARMIIWNAELVEDNEQFCAVPGQVTKIGDGWIDVACGRGKLRVLMCQVEGHADAPAFWIKSIRERLT